VKENPTEPSLKTAFIERRANSLFDTDGIVVGLDQIPIITNREIGSTEPPKAPKDCVAFKMAVSEQSAETTVLEIVWTPSSHGYLIPRIRIEPVKIGGATIEFCTGHNARTIVDKGLGDGARIRIRRSGDVIPTLDEVLVPAQPSLPTKYQWKWDGPEDTAVHLLIIGESAEQQASQLVRFAKELEIPGLGPGHCRTIVQAGILGPAALWAQTQEQLATILGPKTGPMLYANIRTSLGPKVTELQLLLASNQLPRSVGETKLKSLLQQIPDTRQWRNPITTIPIGWTEESLTSFQSTFSNYEQWRKTELHFLPYPLVSVNSVDNTIVNPVVNAVQTKKVCMTGFRDKTLEAKALKAGFEVVQTVSSKLTYLITPDGIITSSEKVKKAQALGIEIIECSEFTKKYLS
jgi:NAD-dependent DNA ligase